MRRVDSLEKTLMLGGIGGRRRRGRQRIRWLDGITNLMGMSLGELRGAVMDREAWHATIHGVAKSWTRLSDWTELNWTVFTVAKVFRLMSTTYVKVYQIIHFTCKLLYAICILRRLLKNWYGPHWVALWETEVWIAISMDNSLCIQISGWKNTHTHTHTHTQILYAYICEYVYIFMNEAMTGKFLSLKV